MNSIIELILRGVDDGASAVLDTARGGLDGLGGALSTVGSIAVGAGAVAGAAMVGVGIAGSQAFMDFEGSMREVFTLMPGMSQQAMDAMNDDVLAFSNEFGTLPNEVIPSLYQAISAGVPPDNVFSFLETAQMAAVGGVTDLETAVDGISSAVNAYGSDVLSAGQASDYMFTAVRLGKTDFEQLSNSLFNVLPTASALGVGLDQVSAGLATLTTQGVPTSVATTQMRQLFVELGSAGSAAADVFQDMAGVTFQEFIGAGGNMQEALQIMEQAATESGVGIQDLFGSVEAGSAALGLTGSAAETFSNALAEMGDSAGATATAYDTMDGGLNRTMDRLRAFGSTALITIGESLSPFLGTLADLAERALPFLTQALDGLTPIIEDVSTFIQGFTSNISSGMGIWDSAVDALLNWTGVGEEYGDTILDISGKVDSFIDTVSGVVQPIVDAIAGFVEWQDVLVVVAGAIGVAVLPIIGGLLASIAAIAIPIGAAIAVVAVLRNAWENDWGGIQEKTQTAIDFVKGIISGGLALIRGWWSEHGEDVKRTVSTFMTTARNTISNIINAVKRLVGRVLDGVQDFWQTHGDEIQRIAETAWNFIHDAIDTVLGTIKGLVDTFALAFEGDWRGFGESLRGVTDTAWEGIKNAISDAIDGIWPIITGLVSGIIEKFNETDWGEVGSNIIHGIANAISAGASAIIDAARNAAQAALDAAKGFLGIESPSRVAAEQIGKPFIQGFTVGADEELSTAARQIQRSLGAITVDLSDESRRERGRGQPLIQPAITSPFPAQNVTIRHTYNVKIEDVRAMALFLDYLEHTIDQNALKAVA